MKKIPIFFTFDDNYAPQAGVTFESLLSTAHTDIFYELYVVHTSVTALSINLLHEIVEKHGNAKLSFIDVSEQFNFVFNSDKFATSHAGAIFTVDTLYRCCPMMIGEFDKYDKIIYSDVDIVVVDDISDIYETDLGETYVAGVNAPAFLRDERTHLDQKFEGCYLGGGILVMNLKKMRLDNLGEKIKKIIDDPPCRLRWVDQDVINLACDTKVSFLSFRYISIPEWQPLLVEKEFFDEYYPSGELYDAMFWPKIIHYAGKKPWNDTKVLKADLWFYWLSKTPFANRFAKFKYPVDMYKYRIYILGLKLFSITGTFVKDKVVKKIFRLSLLKLRRSRVD